MGSLAWRTVGELEGGLILSPERYDPRRNVVSGSQLRLGDVAEVSAETMTVQPKGCRVLVLDTTHALEGFVLARHSPILRAALKGVKRRLRAGDVIVSRLRPYLRQVAYVDEGLFVDAIGDREVAASTEFYVLRARSGFDVAALVPFLLSAEVQAALAAAQEGGHHPRVGISALRALPIPDWLVRESGRLGAEVRRDADAVRAAFLAGAQRSVEVGAANGGEPRPPR